MCKKKKKILESPETIAVAFFSIFLTKRSNDKKGTVQDVSVFYVFCWLLNKLIAVVAYVHTFLPMLFTLYSVEFVFYCCCCRSCLWNWFKFVWWVPSVQPPISTTTATSTTNIHGQSVFVWILQP